MGLSRHKEICEAIKTALDADTLLSAVLGTGEFKLQKKYWNRYSSFQEVKSKGFIAPLRRTNPVFENLKVKWMCPVLVGVMIPADGSVKMSSTDDDILIQVAERLEDIFCSQGKNKIPAVIAAVGQSRTPDTEKFYFELCTATTGDPYIEPAIQAGFEAVAVVVTITIQFNKKDFSTLGS